MSASDVEADAGSGADLPADPVEVPYTELPAGTLRRVIEHFVLREGTDYGAVEYTLEQKTAHVLRQLERGEARIMFDPDTESVTLIVAGGTLRRK